MKKIRVFIVDDSLFFRKALIDKLSAVSNLEIVGYAVDAFDAKNKIPQLAPDVITLDVEMPRMSGIEFCRQFIPQYRIPVVLVSALNINVFDALSAGAVDFVRKPDMQSPDSVDSFYRDLSRKINIAAVAKIRNTSGSAYTSSGGGQYGSSSGSAASARDASPPGSSSVRERTAHTRASMTRDAAGASPAASRLNIFGLKVTSRRNLASLVVAIGASTGGTEATLEILKRLPKDMPGIVIVQHMPPGFTKMYAERLNRLCALEISEAQNGDKIVPGRAFIAPGDMQMKLVRIGTEYSVRCASGEKVSGHCPSVDVLFNSVADVAGQNAIGVILTGMGSDGAAGMLNMKKRGAYTIGQDKDSCVVYGMPMVAKNIGGVIKELPCQDIADEIVRQINSN